jgi:hypothetical protein
MIVMKQVYMTPTTEKVNVRLFSSLLETVEMGGGTDYANTWDSKENTLDNWDESTDDIYPSMDRKSLWDD